MVFQCKMCGGNLEINQGDKLCTCKYCDTQQTLPRFNDEKRLSLYERANHFRRKNEYDKAMGIYEMILSEDNTDAEVYWSLVLCRYGVEYVEDPKTHKRVPTCNRTVPQSVLMDDDYKAAIQYADDSARVLYQQEALVLEQIQKSILKISSKEDPYDIFLCYKESDEQGERTKDSVIAQEIYQQLSEDGYRVFFSRISLEDKMGIEYEPYIYAALSSAKIMIVVGTCKEYFNAVWVKNEWSRFLGMMKADSDKILIPAYLDMDAYDLPDEFLHLQAQNVGKLGYLQDLSRGISKLLSRQNSAAGDNKTVSVSSEESVDNLVRRIYAFLEDGNASKAASYCEKVLDIKIDEPEVYIAKLILEISTAASCNIRNKEALLKFMDSSYYGNIEKTTLFQKASKYADEESRMYLGELKKRNKDFCYSYIQNEYDGQEANYGKVVGIVKQFMGGTDDSQWKELLEIVNLRHDLKEAENNQSQLKEQIKTRRETIVETDKKLKKMKLVNKRQLQAMGIMSVIGVVSAMAQQSNLVMLCSAVITFLLFVWGFKLLINRPEKRRLKSRIVDNNAVIESLVPLENQGQERISELERELKNRGSH